MLSAADDEHYTLQMQGEMTIYTAGENKQQLLDALTAHERLEIDLSGVSEMDSAGIQLLVLTKREAARKNGYVRLVNHSPAVVQVLELLDLAQFFGDPVVLESRDSSRRGGS